MKKLFIVLAVVSAMMITVVGCKKNTAPATTTAVEATADVVVMDATTDTTADAAK